MDEAPQPAGVSRRSFFKGLGVTAVAATAKRAQTLAEELQKVNDEKVRGPDAVPVSLRINGKTENFNLEPRVTLLDALRN